VQQRKGLLRGPAYGVDETVLDRAFGVRTPLVTVLDGHPHTLAFLAGVVGQPTTCLGVSAFGQAGGVHEVHAHHGLDSQSIVAAAWDLLD
jgi:pyruvate dehydrogenase E1 component